MNNFKVSVVLPIYNIDKYLDKCMKSLLWQTYMNLEILMIDDGSTDSCPAICDGYAEKDNRIVVYHKKNGGLSDARNYGIERATGEYITCIDPDDYVDKDYIEYLVSLVEKYDTKMSICQHRVIFDNGRIQENGSNGEELLDNKVCIERMMYHDVIDTSAWAKLYHRDLFGTVRYPKGKIFEDIGTTYALMLQCSKIAVGYQSKYNYIFHNNSIVNSSFKMSKLDMLEMTDAMAKRVLCEYPDLEDAVLRRRVYARLSTLNQMNTTNEYINEKQSIISFIKRYSGRVVRNPKTPMRDKIALFLLNINYKIYRFAWNAYSNRRGKKK